MGKRPRKAKFDPKKKHKRALHNLLKILPPDQMVEGQTERFKKWQERHPEFADGDLLAAIVLYVVENRHTTF